MTEVAERYLPLYESKMLHQFDDRWATYDGGQTRDVTLEEKADVDFFALPRYWVPDREVSKLVGETQPFVSGWRKICRATDERTLVSFVFPRAGIGDSANVASTSREDAWLLGAFYASFVVDFVARQKVGGTNFNFFHMAQVPVPQPNKVGPAWSQSPDWFRDRIAELIYTSRSMAGAAVALGVPGQPFLWDSERRSLLRAELDAAFFHLYGVARDDVDYIMDTFPIVRRKDEAAYGEYRTKQVILEVFDAMEAAMDAGTEYQTILDPPPGEGPRHPARHPEESRSHRA
ncbi:hypothetical protein GCM10023221_27240 [Luteimicrobium xylanilyticum]|uniref:Uncharacterized protein n=1 Tax=Luteimicrobium xylanilyticum TaxID=1133546 RepID=A0A5P9QAM0_9MICO|nr:hypothetical protein [Luteimicrobium xylanilyticum]QFU98508.1 hypothetical protein KDY119_02024 [Luteimicrobium xylanilyticum]